MKRLILGFIVLLLMDTSAMATTAGKITGVITDAATGESLPGRECDARGGPAKERLPMPRAAI